MIRLCLDNLGLKRHHITILESLIQLGSAIVNENELVFCARQIWRPWVDIIHLAV